jgi:hypothetical protein
MIRQQYHRLCRLYVGIWIFLASSPLSALAYDGKGRWSEATAASSVGSPQWGWLVRDNRKLPWMRRKRQQNSKTATTTSTDTSDNKNAIDGNDDNVDEMVHHLQQQNPAVLVQRDNNNVDEANKKNQNNDKNSFPIVSVLATALQSILYHPKTRYYAASGLQVGLLAYLALTVWQSVAEVLDEYAKETTGAVMANSDSAFCRPIDVARLVNVLDQQQNIPAVLQARLSSDSLPGVGKNTNTNTNNNSRNGDWPPLPVLSMAQKLLMTGMPLRWLVSSEEDDAVGTTTATSVESVLLSLTRSEAALLQQCLWIPPSLQGTAVRQAWENVAGLNSVKMRLLDSVANIRHDDKKSLQVYSTLFDNASGGILLYGPPGCGKTMLIKALAGTTRMPCLIVTPSLLLRKYVGDTNLQVRSLFSLANKLAPCLVCINFLVSVLRCSVLVWSAFSHLFTEFVCVFVHCSCALMNWTVFSGNAIPMSMK